MGIGSRTLPSPGLLICCCWQARICCCCARRLAHGAAATCSSRERGVPGWKLVREIESVLPDVVGDGWAEQVGAGVALAEALAQAGGGDILLDAGEDVDALALGGGEIERGEAVVRE